MRQFKFKEWVFKNLFPYYYQENDTYHDSSGKGILQRFIEVCSQYFDDDIIDDNGTQPGLDNIINLIDVDLTPELFLNYLWEFLGEIPYAYGLIIQGKTYDKDDLRGWLFNNTDFPQADPRKLLKYAISLYKIRGTEQFYDVLGHFYGFNIELVETVNGGNIGDDNLTPSHDHLVLATYSETEVDPTYQQHGYISKTDGSVVESDLYDYTVIELLNAKSIRILGNSYRTPSSWNNGYAFYDANDDVIEVHSWDQNNNLPSGKNQQPKEYNLTVPDGAVYFKMSVFVGDNTTYDIVRPSNFYCFLDFDETVATYSLSSDEVRAPYPDGDCYSCLYFLVKVGMSAERHAQLVSQGRLNTVIDLLIGIIEKYLPIHCKIAHYNNGDPKVVIRAYGDFNDGDFNDDFANQDESV